MSSFYQAHNQIICFVTTDSVKKLMDLREQGSVWVTVRGTLKQAGHLSCVLEECSITESSPWFTRDGEAWALVGTFLGSDQITADRLWNLLCLNGIECKMSGSEYFSVSVRSQNAERARDILKQEILQNGLRADVSKPSQD